MGKVKTAIMLVIAIVALAVAVPVAVPAGEALASAHVVKVGYPILPNFQEGAQGERKSGQGYEYLQKIGSYAGWEFEYVYGDLDELQAKLSSGEIDLMGHITYTKQRAKEYSFGSNEQGRESYFLYVNGSNSPISADDLSTVNGKKIAAIAGSYQEGLWKKWCREQGVQCRVVEFHEVGKAETALNCGEVDAFLGILMPNRDEATSGWHSVLSFGEAPYYFAVSKSKPKLLKQLNKAQTEILSDNPYYNEELVTRYATNSILTRTQMPSDEKAWLAARSEPLKVGIMEDAMPICGFNEQGAMAGVVPDLLAAMKESYSDANLNFKLIPYADYDQMVSDLHAGAIDIAAPAYVDYWDAEKADVSLTNSYLSTTMLLLFKSGSRPSDIKKIGVEEQNPVQVAYAQTYYPNCEMVGYATADEVAKGVRRGEVDAALSTACRYHVTAILSKNVGELSRSTLPTSIHLSFAVSRDNPRLLSVLNRGISTVSAAVVNDSLTVNSSVDEEVTLGDFIIAHPVPTALTCLVIFFLMTGVIVRLRRANRRALTDSMTGLLNKVAMRENVKSELARGGALFVIDIDDFKTINDTLGHQAGDAVIMYFAEELQGIFRGGDLISRFGGDEFVVFMPTSEVNEELVREKAELILDVMESCPAVIANKGHLPGSASVGVALVEPRSGAAYFDVFNKADAALYEAKQAGKAAFVIAK